MSASAAGGSSGRSRRTVKLLPWPIGSTCRIEVRASPPDPIDEAAAAREWDRQRALNPRLFDAPILAADDFAPGVVRAHASTYRRLVVQPAVPTRTEQLSVTAVVVRNDGGVPRALLGRRSAQTRIYQSMWELGPSGGIDPPATDATVRTNAGAAPTVLGWAEVCAQVRREAAEELGGADWVVPRRAWGVCRDVVAHSADVVVECGWSGPEPAGGEPADAGRWEYDGLAWVSRAEMAGFVRAHEVIEPSVALLVALGWIGGAGGTGQMGEDERQ